MPEDQSSIQPVLRYGGGARLLLNFHFRGGAFAPFESSPSVKLASIRENHLLVTVAFPSPSAEEEK
jgi:hypothetical protein